MTIFAVRICFDGGSSVTRHFGTFEDAKRHYDIVVACGHDEREIWISRGTVKDIPRYVEILELPQARSVSDAQCLLKENPKIQPIEFAGVEQGWFPELWGLLERSQSAQSSG